MLVAKKKTPQLVNAVEEAEKNKESEFMPAVKPQSQQPDLPVKAGGLMKKPKAPEQPVKSSGGLVRKAKDPEVVSPSKPVVSRTQSEETDVEDNVTPFVEVRDGMKVSYRRNNKPPAPTLNTKTPVHLEHSISVTQGNLVMRVHIWNYFVVMSLHEVGPEGERGLFDMRTTHVNANIPKIPLVENVIKAVNKMGMMAMTVAKENLK